VAAWKTTPPVAVAPNTPSMTTRRVETAHYCAIPP